MEFIDGEKYQWAIYILDVVPFQRGDNSYWKIIDCSDSEPNGYILCWKELLATLSQTQQLINGYIVGTTQTINLSKYKGKILRDMQQIQDNGIYFLMQVDDGNLISVFTEDEKIIHRFKIYFKNLDNVEIFEI
jgi:hypothetical protein